MQLEALKGLMGIEQRVAIVEPHDQAERDAPCRHGVDEPAAELLHPKGVAERVDHGARRNAVGRHVPQLLDPDGVLLGLAPLGQGQAREELLGQVAADTVAEDRDLRVDVDAWLEGAPALAIAADAAVAGPHADHAIAVKQHFDAWKPREQVDARGFHALGQPLAEAAHRDDQVAVVAQGRRRERQRDLAAGVEHVDAVFVDVGLDGRALLAEVRDELGEARRIEHGARQQVRASLARLFEHRDGQRLAAPRLLELRQPQRRRQSGRTAANDEDVDFEGFSVHQALRRN